MAWLQQQLTRERPDTFTQAASDSRTKDLATPGRQMRAFCLEYGIAIRPGGAFKLDIARIITDETNANSLGPP